MHIHILGICGTFMGGLALIARAAGHTVTGCDTNVYPPMSVQLEEQGIQLIEGYDPGQLAVNADLYVIGNVISRGNPLIEAILNKNLPYISGPQWLGEQVLRHQKVFAVAGTHGKTTTSAMLAWILEQTGKSPNFLIGGIAPGLEVSARYHPERPYFVIEADEYDTAFFDKRSKFVHYRAHTAILNNVEFDHADIFPDIAAIETQFHHLIRTLPQRGHIIRLNPDPALDRVLEQGVWTPQTSFGPQGHWQAVAGDPPTHFSVHYADNPRQALQNPALGQVRWSLTGEHNRLNGLAAIAAAKDAGVSPTDAIDALSTFTGVKRRMEQRGIVNNITIYDDFAHHPTAIQLTLEGARQQITKGRLIAVLEPRSNTMKLGAMAARLPKALAAADQVFCYNETEGKHALAWDANAVFAPLGNKAAIYQTLDPLINAITTFAKPDDTIVIMSNGSFGGIHEKLLQRLQRQQD